MLRAAVIGMGGIGNRHADCIAAHPKASVVAVCDVAKDKVGAAAKRLDVKAYHDVESMLQAEELDFVNVCTGGFENGGDHYEPTMQCLRASLDVLCEKPISNKIQEGREMVALAGQKQLRLGINLNHRFVEPAYRAKRWIDEGRLGQLLMINMTMWIDNPNESSPWFHLRALHPHSIDVMRYLCGPIKRVQAFCSRGPKADGPRVCYSNAQVNMEFANGVVGHLTGSYDSNPRHNLERCEVLGSEGRLVIENCFEELVFYPRRSDELTVWHNGIMGQVGSFGDTFSNRINKWIDQLTAGDPPDKIVASGEDGLAAQEVIEGAIRSFEKGTIVEVQG